MDLRAERAYDQTDSLLGTTVWRKSHGELPLVVLLSLTLFL